MYEKQFEGKNFLRSNKDIREQFDFYDRAEHLRIYFDDVKKYTLEELFSELQRLNETETPEDKGDIQYIKDQTTTIQKLIQNKIGLGFETHYMIDKLSEEFTHIQKAMDELRELKGRFENHRHRLDKTYGEKPVW